MEVARIEPGLWRWTGHHEEWNDDVGSVYCETADGVVLLDPLVPPESCARPESARADSGRANTPETGDAERFWAALDGDVERVGGEVHVLLTVFWHIRSTAALVERYRARTWVPTTSRAPVARRGVPVSDPFRPGDPLPGGIEAYRTARSTEVVFWIPRHRALVPGDVLLGQQGGGVRLCPQSWLPPKTSLEDLAESLRPLLDLPVERVLVSHGEPVLRHGREALAASLDAP